MDENNFIMTDNEGREIECRILFTCNLEGFEGQYVIFQMQDTEEVTAAKYKEIGEGDGELIDVESDEEWEQLEEILEKYYDDLEAEEEE